MSKLKVLLYCNVYDTVVGQSIAYMEFFSNFGDVILVTSEMDLNYWLREGNILALPGGQDLLSSRYGAAPGWFSKNVNTHYEFLDEHLLRPWLKTHKPIIGICRGMQALNVACGGTLHRNIQGHVQNDKKDRSDRPEIMYSHIDDYQIHMINTYHHQCVKDVAPGFNILGWSDYDSADKAYKHPDNFREKFYYRPGKDNNQQPVISENAYAMVPEIMRHKGLPYIAFQYHPEEFSCPLATSLISETLDNYIKNHEKYLISKEKLTREPIKEN